MNKFFIPLSFILILGLSACGQKKANAHHTETAKQASAVIYYGCPMTEHSHVAAKEPGKCPECGMDMVAVIKVAEEEQDFYGCPMAEHSHIRSHVPGNCPECGMALRPLKFDM